MSSAAEADGFLAVLGHLRQNQHLYHALSDRVPPSAPSGSDAQPPTHETNASGPIDIDQIRERLARFKQTEQAKSADTSLGHPLAQVPAALPPDSSWLRSRPFHTTAFSTIKLVAKTPATPLNELSRELQELALVDDLLFLLLGVEGRYIRSSFAEEQSENLYLERDFSLDQITDAALRELTSKILTVCQDYNYIGRLIDEFGRFQQGATNQALSGALQRFNRDYLVLEGCRGADTLSALHMACAAATGDDVTKITLQGITAETARPYFACLSRWISTGAIEDPSEEFMVQEARESTGRVIASPAYSDFYWSKKYSLNRDRVPIFLTDLADDILTIGKCLNVVHSARRDETLPLPAEDLSYAPETTILSTILTQRSLRASQLAVSLMFEQGALAERLLRLRDYFFMTNGDLFIHFWDCAHEELRKTTEHVSVERTSTLLDLAQRTSTERFAAFRDDFSCRFASTNLVSELFRIMKISAQNASQTSFLSLAEADFDSEAEGPTAAFEAFYIDYHPPWPVSLALGRKLLRKYQIVFRHLFYIKVIETDLSASYSFTTPQLRAHHLPWLSTAYALRLQMLNFVHNLQFYLSVEVLEQNHRIFMEQLRTASSLDEMCHMHNDFLDSCLKECLLTAPALLKSVSKLLKLCQLFRDYMERWIRAASLRLIKTSHVVQQPSDDVQMENVRKLQTKFLEHMSHLLAQLTQTAATENMAKLANLVARFNTNRFYQDEVMQAELMQRKARHQFPAGEEEEEEEEE
ncbi:uncharacterized protein MONBRDRAFT_32608 [Monosiga brevicollis MX1]|uniref:Spindle pole body component n=1 Tax=Monosiga brevicollis TaxID=81824 RepID=A9V0P3_MONBE|nr:uncharacterized protein MONBRDRAFT_32608 [Monosiga brevicollis MX1]EDQ88788.1 predicted protein [Monosiga brevicollis MX1]|eukprot:XP_001746401.1 hypothetical protein [Monosiga brevicollis MX1]